MKIVTRLMTIIFFIVILAIIIIYARGYRLDFKKKSLTATGILAVSSSPKPAKVYLDGQLKGVTDINLTLPPDVYQLEIKKDGYTSWSKTIKIKGELVISVDALLFPTNPSFSPLTNLGITKAIPVNQTDKILLLSLNDNEEKDGFYLFEASKKPLSFLSPLKLILKKTNIPNFDQIDFKKTAIYFSPDYKQAIIDFFSLLPNYQLPIHNYSYLISLEELNQTLFDVTLSRQTLLTAWEKEKEKNNLKILETFPKDFVKIATDSFRLISFSPNETKILYQAKKSVTLPLIINPPLIASNQTEEERTVKKDNLYVYDKKEDKNFPLKLLTLNSELLTFTQWFPDSKHLVFLDKNKVSAIDYDSSNKQIVYSGPLEKDFFTISSNGDLIILANFNPETNQWPDLYAIEIK